MSEYTDNVDVVRGYSWRTSKGEVIQQELDDVFRLLGGLLVAGDFKARPAQPCTAPPVLAPPARTRGRYLRCPRGAGVRAGPWLGVVCSAQRRRGSSVERRAGGGAGSLVAA